MLDVHVLVHPGSTCTCHSNTQVSPPGVYEQPKADQDHQQVHIGGLVPRLVQGVVDVPGLVAQNAMSTHSDAAPDAEGGGLLMDEREGERSPGRQQSRQAMATSVLSSSLLSVSAFAPPPAASDWLTGNSVIHCCRPLCLCIRDASPPK